MNVCSDVILFEIIPKLEIGELLIFSWTSSVFRKHIHTRYPHVMQLVKVYRFLNDPDYKMTSDERIKHETIWEIYRDGHIGRRLRNSDFGLFDDFDIVFKTHKHYLEWFYNAGWCSDLNIWLWMLIYSINCGMYYIADYIVSKKIEIDNCGVELVLRIVNPRSNGFNLHVNSQKALSIVCLSYLAKNKNPKIFTDFMSQLIMTNNSELFESCARILHKTKGNGKVCYRKLLKQSIEYDAIKIISCILDKYPDMRIDAIKMAQKLHKIGLGELLMY